MNKRILMMTVVALWVCGPDVAAQEARGLTVGAGAGGTFYCIDTRCDSGTMIGLSSGVSLTPSVGVELSGRWHQCFDCDRFLIGDAALVFQYRHARIRPYAGGGVGYSSDPGFMGSHIGLMATVGALTSLADRWMLRADVRGRQVGSSSSMGEFTVWLDYRIPH